jgi:radical SAM superfamily enzyme YgiQ (UPF0313 family)
MKIALIYPTTNPLPDDSFPHLGLGYLAAIARQEGHTARIFDMRIRKFAEEKQYLREDFNLFGITASSFSFSEASLIAESVKKRFPEKIVVLGGPHVSIGPEDIFLKSHFDTGVVGEGEETFRELLAALENGRIDELKAIRGLIFVENGKIIRTGFRTLIKNIDKLPLPDFTSLPMENYSRFPILTSRGCPFQCTYCCSDILWGRKWRFRSPENLVNEIKHALDFYNWNNKHFVIVDDTFNLNPERVEAFCDDLLNERMNINYYIWGFRADRAPIRMLQKMKESGCIGVSIGVESANPEVLKNIRKGESIEQITETVKNLQQTGIYPNCLFMIGNPGDTMETVMQTMRYVKKNRLYLVGFNMALPYPKTEFWNYVENQGKFLRTDFTNYHHFSDTPIFETNDFTAKERSKAFALCRQLEIKQRLKFEVMRKISFILHGDYRSLSPKRLAAALSRMTKYIIDLLLHRIPREKL